MVLELLTNPVFLALLGTLFGSAGLKVIEYWLSRAKVKEDDATRLRSELRSEADRIRIELADTEKQLDIWKEKYYTLMEESIQIKSELRAALGLVKKDAQKGLDESK